MFETLKKLPLKIEIKDIPKFKNNDKIINKEKISIGFIHDNIKNTVLIN